MEHPVDVVPPDGIQSRQSNGLMTPSRGWGITMTHVPDSEIRRLLELEQQGQLMGRRGFIAGAMTLGGALAFGGLAGCAGDDSNGSAGTLGTAPGTAGADAMRGGSLRLGTSGVVFPNFYLGTSFGVQLVSYVQFAWPTFMGSPAGVELENALAESYARSDDGLIHTIVLRPDLLFHDGSPIDAEAVAENYRSCFFADHPLRDDGAYTMTSGGFGVPPAVDRVDVTDELTLEIHLTTPRADIRDALSTHLVMNPAVLAQPGYGTDVGALRDAGSGPFRITGFQPGSSVEYEGFEGFHRDVLLDRLRLEEIGDPAAMGLALRSGQVDGALGLSKSDHDAFVEDPDYTLFVSEPAAFSVVFVFSSPRKPELEDRRVREAIALAMNREEYRDAFFSAGTVSPSTQMMHPSRAGYNPDVEEWPYDPDRARELLDEAGVERLSLSLLGRPSTNYIPELAALLQAMQADLETVGIDVEITMTDPASWFVERPNYDGWMTNLGPEVPTVIFPLFFTPGQSMPADDEGNWPSHDPRSHPEVMPLMEAAMGAFDPDEQDRLFQQLTQLHQDEILMYIPLALVGSSAIARSQVHGVQPWAFKALSQETAWVDET